jgi:septum formation protein
MTAHDPPCLYLASTSPRRRELLKQLGVCFEVLKPAVDESPLPGEDASSYVQRLAALKAQAGWSQLPPQRRAPVLGADTTVVLGTQILGKPADRDDAIDMLLRLSGRTHVVLTSIALCSARGLAQRCSRSEVTFQVIEPATAAAYWDTGEPADKAGGYAIQGFGACFAKHLSGSFSGVMGLPLYETAEILTEARVPQWRRE